MMSIWKRQRYLRGIALTALVAAIGLSEAQAQPRMEDAGRRERAREGRGEHESDRPYMVERWLDKVAEIDPEEYERMLELKERNPAAFRVQLRRRVHDARVLDLLQEEYPQLHEYLAGMEREDRERIGHVLRGGGGGESEPMGPARHRRLLLPGIEHDETMRALLAKWHAAESEEEKDAARTALRAHMETVFDQRSVEQEDQIQRAEEQVERLRRLLEARRQNRELWIDRQIDHLLRAQETRGRESGRRLER